MAVSHDVKTPLTSIKGYLEAIADGLAEDPERLRRYVGIAREKAEVLESRISELIQFVRMESGEWPLHRRSLSLAELCRGAVADLKEDVGVFLRRFFERIELDEQLEVEADPDLMVRVFENVVDNAIRYTGPEDTITFAACADDGLCRRSPSPTQARGFAQRICRGCLTPSFAGLTPAGNKAPGWASL